MKGGHQYEFYTGKAVRCIGTYLCSNSLMLLARVLWYCTISEKRNEKALRLTSLLPCGKVERGRGVAGPYFTSCLKVRV